VPVLIIVEDPSPEDRKKLLRSLCGNLNYHSKSKLENKFHIYISSRKSSAILECLDVSSYNLEHVLGFNKQETIEYLKVGECEKEKKAAVEIHKLFGGLPLGLQIAKGYCKKVRISYMYYLDLVQDIEYDIINEEKKIAEEYGESAQHVFPAIVLPFVPNDKDDTTAVLPWKILCCISYFNYDRIPLSALEQCCHILRDVKVKKPHIKNRVEVGSLISKLVEHNMCTETDEGELTFHEVVINAFRLNKHSVLTEDFMPLKKATEIMCSLVSKDMRKKGHSTRMHKLLRHIQTLLGHLENNKYIFEEVKDSILLKALTSHLHETTAAILLYENESPLFRKEAGQHFEKALTQIWPEISRYSHSQLLKCEKSEEEIAKDVLKSSKEKALNLPTDFTTMYASKLEFCIDEEELEFLKKRSASEACFASVKNLLEEKGCTKTQVRKLQDCGLFLPDDKYRPIFYAERFAFILHSWSRLVLYGDPEEVKEMGEKCIRMSNLSYRVSIECKKRYNVSLLAEHLSRTGGWVPIVLKLKRSPEDLEKALTTCKGAMDKPATNDMYENGMLKEVFGPSHCASRILLLRYIVRISARLYKGSAPEFVTEADKMCQQLVELSVKHAKKISSCLMNLIYCAKYYAAKEKFDKAFDCFQKYFDLNEDCNPRFNLHCWATFNYARAVNADKSVPSDQRADAAAKCCKALKRNDVMNRSLKKELNRCLKQLQT